MRATIHMPGLLQAVIVYNKNNTFGLSKDAEILAEALPAIGRSIGHAIEQVKIVDVREPPVACDICVHLEVPYAVWFPWAAVNMILVNSEWWLEDKWSAYWDSFDVALFRDKASMDRCLTAAGTSGQPRHAMVVPWCVGGPFKPVSKKDIQVSKGSNSHADGFVWFVGGSPNKRAAAKAIVPLWKDSYPRLTVCALEDLKLGAALPSNVTVKYGYVSDREFKAMSEAHPGHICLSRAEAFGYTAAEAEANAAFSVLNTLPAYTEAYSDSDGIAWFETELGENGFANFEGGGAYFEAQLDKIIAKFLESDLAGLRRKRSFAAEERKATFLTSMGEAVKECVEAMKTRSKIPKHMPPLLNQQDCPPITVVTLVHNRPKFVQNACLNLLSSDYPRDKLEWIIVDDSDPEQSASDRIMQFADRFGSEAVTYIPLARKRSIGFKRNLACERAKHDIILMMDDDDHYPSTSFRRRVAYLLKGRDSYECAVCTTIAMYDLMKGVSAVNVPPYTLSLAERCSEATLTFTKRFWQAQKFPEVDMAEGEGFLSGRCSQVVEMPPQQLIVALTHGNNLSGRKMPDAKPGCFWGFPRPLLEFLHGLVGIKVEESNT